MEPDADHVKISIWPGVSRIMKLSGRSVRGFNGMKEELTRANQRASPRDRELDQISS